ncbi:hypothetical protein P4O66_020531 [Electrophorus voltai]|uniref:Peptidase metallopeptidase domain-containing protein n=1 Tax=Electrophorus voltai TaxID=2609070 RepID=A0AAD8ZS86_9TELE|nr:hypothetical protein P4O66_020531 [Electrophorus voltai]
MSPGRGVSELEGKDWLTKYGYLPPPDPSTGQLQVWSAVTQAVKAMQRFAGLDDTGALDEETLRLMQTPRCSLPDKGSEVSALSASDAEGHGQRMKRAASPWTQRNINWRLQSYPASSGLSREMIRTLVFYALRVWAEPTLLEFHEVGGPKGTDLQIDFLYGSHGDGYPFDGAGGAVGHAFFPSDPDRAGEVHLDAEEDWAFRQPASEGTDLFTVLVHELGHALGLSHSSTRRSVMRPYYQEPLGDPLNFSLDPPDRQHITALYGKRGQHLHTDNHPLEAEAQLRRQQGDTLTNRHKHTFSYSVDRCNTTFDAVAKIRGETFFFKGLRMWRVSRDGLISKKAVSVRRLWGALPSSLPPLRAVLERNTDHAIIFISGSHVWLFKDLSLQEGFPKTLSALAPSGLDGGWQGLHWEPERGVVWGPLRERADKREGDEEESRVWKELIEGGLNGMLVENDGSIYLFKGHSYWKFPYPGSAPEEGYPRPLATDWLDCPHPSPFQPSDVSLISAIGQQEQQKRKDQATVDQIRHRDKVVNTQPYWDCPCLNRATQSNAGLRLLIFTLLSLTFTRVPVTL